MDRPLPPDKFIFNYFIHKIFSPSIVFNKWSTFYFFSERSRSCSPEIPFNPHTSHPTFPSGSTSPELKQSLREITEVLNIVVKRVQGVESELKEQRNRPDSTPKRAKVAVPLVVRVSAD